MKKIIIILAIIILISVISKENKVIIPNDAIRFRVIANSNEKEDQKIKKEITTNIYNQFASQINQNKNINSTREEINLQLPTIKFIVEKTLYSKSLPIKYDINYGINYFPKKEYKGVIYPEGEYESLVITLGDGLGDNFWCVLFPPLCLLEAEEEETSNVEYTSFIKEVIEKYFKVIKYIR